MIQSLTLRRVSQGELCSGLPREPAAGLARRCGRVVGPIASCQTGHANDPEIRFRGSSGSVLTALAVTALETGLVDGIVHVAADPDRPTRNDTVISRDRASVLSAGNVTCSLASRAMSRR